MGSHRNYRGDWIRLNQNRYLSDDSPKVAMDAAQHVLAARAALEIGEVEVAEFMYRGAERLWVQMERSDPGHWCEEIRSTHREHVKMSSHSHGN